ncbi:hypothetical protein V6N13_075346 [Hibiscus sabdariffa]
MEKLWKRTRASPMPKMRLHIIFLLLFCRFGTGISLTADQFKLDEAAPVLAGLKEPIVIAKVNADKFTRLASKHDVDAYPTLKLFIHGVSMEYYGPRQSDRLVQYLKKFVAPNVSILTSDSAISGFIKEAGTFFPIFIGFGLNETVLSNLAVKYKKRAWFSVTKDFSSEAMVLYDLEKVPALVVIHPNYKQQSIFYGPFEVVPLNHETLKLLKDEERKIVLTITADENEDQSQNLIKLLKDAASANHDLVFGYFGLKQWEDFADKFEANEKTKLPKMIVWNGDEEYFSVIGIESLGDEDQGSRISQFLEGYRQGRTEKKTVKVPLFMGLFKSLVGIGAFFIIFIVVAMMIMMIVLMVIISKDNEPLTNDSHDKVGHAKSSEAENNQHRLEKKED